MRGLFYQSSSENWKGPQSAGMKIGRKGSVQIAAFIKRMGMKIGYLCKKGLFFCVYLPKTQAFKEGQYCRVKTKMRLLKRTGSAFF